MKGEVSLADLTNETEGKRAGPPRILFSLAGGELPNRQDLHVDGRSVSLFLTDEIACRGRSCSAAGILWICNQLWPLKSCMAGRVIISAQAP